MRIAGAIAATGVVAIIAWMLLRDRDHVEKPSSSEPTQSSALTTAPAPPALPSSPSTERTPIVDSTHTKVQEIGRRCFQARTPHAAAPGEPDDTVGRLELALRIRVASGIARVESAEVASTRHLREDIRDCIVAATRTASWPVSAPDGTTEIGELFRMGDYVAVSGPDSPPSSPPTR